MGTATLACEGQNSISYEDFRDGARSAVLNALDGYMRELTGCEHARGASDADLPALFGGLDKHLERLAARFNDPNSTEIGSAAIQIIDL